MPVTKLLPLPCHAVIFISQRLRGDNGYGDAAARMTELGSSQPGFLGISSARSADGQGISVVFYETAEAARAWGRNPVHRDTMRMGQEDWYESYAIYYAEVARGHDWQRPDAQAQRGTGV